MRPLSISPATPVFVYPPSGNCPTRGTTPDGRPWGFWTLSKEATMKPLGVFCVGDLRLIEEGVAA